MAQPMFFGPAERKLFGVYYPRPAAASGQAVVLCPPAPAEYMSSHWAMRRLATALSKAGVHVLRFDYYGMGDSMGDSDDGTLEGWQEDILTAQSTLAELSGVERTSLLGLRLGASLACRASRATSQRPRDLILWNPVISGASYLKKLQQAEIAFGARLLSFPKLHDPPRELGGHPISPAELNATRALDLLDEPPPEATRVHLYVNDEDSLTSALSKRFESAFKRFTYQHVQEEAAQRGGSLLANRVLQVITAALAPEVAR